MPIIEIPKFILTFNTFLMCNLCRYYDTYFDTLLALIRKTRLINC